MKKMSPEGSVLGVDVGWSTERKSSAVCCLAWDEQRVNWEMCRFQANDEEREQAIRRTARGLSLLAVAIDGPLRPGFSKIGCYRSAERLLSRGKLLRVGKPGQSNSPNGEKLNEQANLTARFAKEHFCIERANAAVRIDKHAIVEAFPTTFLGVMVDGPEALKSSEKRSDQYFAHLARKGRLDRVLKGLLPGRRPAQSLATVVDHDERAALVCALTALCVVAGDFTAVGDDQNGWIVLPPRRQFADWAWTGLRENVERETDGGKLQVVYCGLPDQGEPALAKSSANEPVSDDWANSGPTGSAAFDLVQASLTVDMIMTARNDLVMCRCDENVATVVKDNTDRYSYFPVKDETGNVLGLLRAEEWFDEEAPSCPVGEVYEPLSERHLIGAQESIISFASKADEVPVRLVRGRQGISGLVTISDLQKLPVRAALFALVTGLELAMYRRIKMEWDNDRGGWLGCLSQGRQHKLKQRIKDAEGADAFVDKLVLTQLKDKARIVVDRGLLPGISKTALRAQFEDIEELRNILAHANFYATDPDRAKKASKTVRDILAIWRALLPVRPAEITPPQ